MADLDAMDEEWAVLLYYCIANPNEEVDASEEVVRRRGICTGVGAGATISDAVEAVKRASGVKQVDDVHRLRLTPQRSWVAISPQVSGYVCNKGDEFFFRVIRRGVPHGIGGSESSTDWRVPGQRVEKLKLQFSKRLRQARVVMDSTLRSDSGPLELDNGQLDPQAIGNYFTIKGRRCTLETLIGAGAEIFNTYMSNVQEDLHKRSKFFAMMVAYPGAGKTTIGTDFPRLLRRFWIERSRRVEQILRFVWKGRDAPNKKAFVSMVNDSLQLGFEICMYHSVAASASPDGGVLWPEMGLPAECLLALRCLHAALSSPSRALDYLEFLHSLEAALPGLKQHLRLEDVVLFIRQEFGIEEDKRILLSWFFDELNAARAPAGQASFAQNMLSAFVDWAHIHRARGSDDGIQQKIHRNTFVVMSGATTRFSASSMALTQNGRAKSIFVPTRSLLLHEVEQVVSVFLRRLAITVNENPVGLPPVLNATLPLTGGHPRLIAYLLRAVYSTLSAEVDARCFWEHLQSAPSTPRFMSTVISRLLVLMHSDGYFEKYSDPSRMRLVMAVIRTSLLARSVKRSAKVLEGEFDDTYADLEAQGLLAFGMDSKLNLEGHISFGNLEARVFVSPLLIRLLLELRSSAFGVTIPQFHLIGWREKEIDDLFGIRFNILLYKELYGEDQPFRLADILPSNWVIPARYSTLEFSVPCNGVKAHKVTGKLDTLEKFMDCINATKGCWAFIGPGALAADSWLVLRVHSSGKELYIFLESKTSTKTVEDHKMISKMVKDLKIWVRIPVEDVDIKFDEGLAGKRRKCQVVDYSEEGDDSEDQDQDYVEEEDDDDTEVDEQSSRDFRIPLDKVLFVYNTEENVRVNSGGSWLKRHLILARHHENSPWHMLSKISHLLQPQKSRK